ncbi:hypothetical protein EON65_37295 [archaeon]|nr:MAG: hypothetical protein EON65_37295 [archaeon]
MKIAKFIFLGAPGAGKGTYAKLLCSRSNGKWRHLSPGDFFRQEIKNQTPTGQLLTSYIQSGKLVPENTVMDVWLPKVTKELEELEKTYSVSEVAFPPGVILDGYPRSLAQCNALDTLVPQGQNFVAININLRKDILVSKLLGRCNCKLCGASYNTADILDGEYDMPAILPTTPCRVANAGELCSKHFEKRADDIEEVIRHRLEEYEQSVHGILDYYKKQNRLIEIELKRGVKDIDKLWNIMSQERL